MKVCAHEGWGISKPAEMEQGPCEHVQQCPVCRLRISISPCGHEMTAPPISYRVAVNLPIEVR